MAETYTITVTRDSDGQAVFIYHEVDPDRFYDNRSYEELEEGLEPFTDAQKVLYIAAPEMCPWDCDHCRG